MQSFWCKVRTQPILPVDMPIALLELFANDVRDDSDEHDASGDSSSSSSSESSTSSSSSNSTSAGRVNAEEAELRWIRGRRRTEAARAQRRINAEKRRQATCFTIWAASFLFWMNWNWSPCFSFREAALWKLGSTNIIICFDVWLNMKPTHISINHRSSMSLSYHTISISSQSVGISRDSINLSQNSLSSLSH